MKKFVTLLCVLLLPCLSYAGDDCLKQLTESQRYQQTVLDAANKKFDAKIENWKKDKRISPSYELNVARAIAEDAQWNKTFTKQVDLAGKMIDANANGDCKALDKIIKKQISVLEQEWKRSYEIIDEVAKQELEKAK